MWGLFHSKPASPAARLSCTGAAVSVTVCVALWAQGGEPGPFQLGKGVPGPMARGWLPAGQVLAAEECSRCHVAEGKKWRGGFRPTAFSNAFVQAEYRLAWAKAKREGTDDGLPASCVACHSPLQYLQGKVPAPEEPLSADEGITCDFCHSTWGFSGEVPGQFNWIVRKGGNRFGPEIQSALGRPVRFTKSPELCGTCHNERGPGGQWVKSVYNEWKESPYSKTGEKGCLDCHKQFTREFVNGMIPRSVELRLEPPASPPRPGAELEVSVELANAAAGHRIPAGSSELRQLWLHVEAVDGAGRAYPLSVRPKGFEGEEHTIGSDARAYFDLQELAGGQAAGGLPRDGDGIAPGDRVFRLPMFDRQGRMTAFEWNAYALGTDYRLGPQETVTERYAFQVPSDLPPGPLAITATLRYRRAPPALWAFLRLPAGENPEITVGEARWQGHAGSTAHAPPSPAGARKKTLDMGARAGTWENKIP